LLHLDLRELGNLLVDREAFEAGISGVSRLVVIHCGASRTHDSLFAVTRIGINTGEHAVAILLAVLHALLGQFEQLFVLLAVFVLFYHLVGRLLALLLLIKEHDDLHARFGLVLAELLGQPVQRHQNDLADALHVGQWLETQG
jgi:hypothetical protein